MKNQKNVCPGCSRHCTEECIRCKRGRMYFEKCRAHMHDEDGHRRKWEKHVAPEGVLWQMLKFSSNVKKALKHGDISEEQILGRLSSEERHELTVLLEKMKGQIKKENESVSKA